MTQCYFCDCAGNNYECEYVYSFAAILVKVPPAAKRTHRPSIKGSS